MRFAAVVNANAGTARRLGVRAIRALFEERLGEQLLSLRILKPRYLNEGLREALSNKPDALLVLGGDGTARCAAQEAARADVPLAFLPGGTMNILPKRLFGEATLDEILGALGRGDVERVRVAAGFAGGVPFFVGAAFGFIPLLAQAREMQRGAHWLVDGVRASLRVARHGPRLFKPHLAFKAGAPEPQSASALLIALGDADAMVPGRAAHDERPGFEIVSLHVSTWSALLALSLNVLANQDWRKDRRVTALNGHKVDILKRGRVRLTLDGEPAVMDGPLCVTFRRDGVHALALRKSRAAREEADERHAAAGASF